VQKPKTRDRAAASGERIGFTSNILPKWARRTKSLDVLLSVLYLRGISAGDFQEAFAALLDKDAPNLSAARRARFRADPDARWAKPTFIRTACCRRALRSARRSSSAASRGCALFLHWLIAARCGFRQRKFCTIISASICPRQY
jgi:hypothetical protein